MGSKRQLCGEFKEPQTTALNIGPAHCSALPVQTSLFDIYEVWWLEVIPTCHVSKEWRALQFYFPGVGSIEGVLKHGGLQLPGTDWVGKIGQACSVWPVASHSGERMMKLRVGLSFSWHSPTQPALQSSALCRITLCSIGLGPSVFWVPRTCRGTRKWGAHQLPCRGTATESGFCVSLFSSNLFSSLIAGLLNFGLTDISGWVISVWWGLALCTGRCLFSTRCQKQPHPQRLQKSQAFAKCPQGS